MAKRRSKTAKKNRSPESFSLKGFFQSSATHSLVGAIILGFAIFTGIAMISFFFSGAVDQSKVENLSLFHYGTIEGIENWTGKRGAILSNILMNKWFGISTFFLLMFVVLVALRLMKVGYSNLLRSFMVYAILMVWASVALTFFFGSFFEDSSFFYIGGKHGFFISKLLKENYGIPGTFLIIVLTFLVIMTILNAQTIPFLRNLFKLKLPEKKWKWEWKGAKKKKEKEEEEDEDEEEEEEEKYPVKSKVRPLVVKIPKKDDFEIIDTTLEEEESPVPVKENKGNKQKEDEDEDDEERDLVAELGLYNPTLDLAHYQFPTLDLLKKYDSNDNTQINYEEQTENKNQIIKKLEHYNIKIKSIKATVGPTITLYEIIPEDGIRIAKIKNLEDDIAMSLKAIGIRIIAPMPGKGTIGIEVPNKDPKIVSMYSIIASRKYQESNFELPIALGKTITNEVFMVDLAKMPHLLMAGATGQGKSVGLNAAITSLLYKKHPAELKFVLIDPKMVEFSIYSVIEKHFLAKLPNEENPIITDYTKVIYTLNSLTKEMDDRYSLLKDAGSLRTVKEYNEKFVNRRLNPHKGHRYLPYIVVIIDEFSDLIMTAGKEIELPIARIAQKARAVGIHMIIATQRPTTTIITGTIKANFPARVAFRVISMIDSRTILDAPGANQLVGRGDLLFSQGSDMMRVQCAFVDTPEVDKISKFIANQQGYPTAFELPEYTVDSGDEKQKGVDLSDKDPLFEDAARLIVIHQQGSTSLIQRKFEVGYNRAGRIMDQMEAAGIVGPSQGSKPREVYIIDEYHLEQKLNTLK
jgi:S-DNA-T family DNA segregation ATPase FtsK/SpoIIIE